MLRAICRWRDEVGDTYVLGAVRLVIGLLLFENALRAVRELRAGYFGEVFHWPIVPEWLVPSRSVYGGVVAFQVLFSALVVTGVLSRISMLGSAILGSFILCCDRVQFHHNRAALFFYAFLLSFAPCDRSLALRAVPPEKSVGDLWAARLAQLQLSMIYVASGGSKLLNADWRGGQVLLERFVLYGPQAVSRGIPESLMQWLAQPGPSGALAKVAIATELFLALCLWPRRTRVFALWWGVWFHLTIEVTSRVESFTWLTLAMYALFCTPDVRARKVYYDASRLRGRLLARIVTLSDWLARFEVKPWAPDDVRGKHAIVIVRRDGTPATGVRALAMMARCTPVVFPLWAPLALAASFTKGGEVSARA
jgi:hypothetical protein